MWYNRQLSLGPAQYTSVIALLPAEEQPFYDATDLWTYRGDVYTDAKNKAFWHKHQTYLIAAKKAIGNLPHVSVLQVVDTAEAVFLAPTSLDYPHVHATLRIMSEGQAVALAFSPYFFHHNTDEARKLIATRGGEFDRVLECYQYPASTEASARYHTLLEPAIQQRQQEQRRQLTDLQLTTIDHYFRDLVDADTGTFARFQLLRQSLQRSLPMPAYRAQPMLLPYFLEAQEHSWLRRFLVVYSVEKTTNVISKSLIAAHQFSEQAAIDQIPVLIRDHQGEVSLWQITMSMLMGTPVLALASPDKDLPTIHGGLYKKPSRIFSHDVVHQRRSSILMQYIRNVKTKDDKPLLKLHQLLKNLSRQLEAMRVDEAPVVSPTITLKRVLLVIAGFIFLHELDELLPLELLDPKELSAEQRSRIVGVFSKTTSLNTIGALRSHSRQYYAALQEQDVQAIFDLHAQFQVRSSLNISSGDLLQLFRRVGIIFPDSEVILSQLEPIEDQAMINSYLRVVLSLGCLFEKWLLGE